MVEFSSGHISVQIMSLIGKWKCVVLQLDHNFGQMSFFSGNILSRTRVAVGQMSF
jgi:hypothetical protein